MADRIVTYTQDRDVKISTFGQPPIDGELMELDWYYEIPIGARVSPITQFDIRNVQNYIIRFLANRFTVYQGGLMFYANHYTIYRDAD